MRKLTTTATMTMRVWAPDEAEPDVEFMLAPPASVDVEGGTGRVWVGDAVVEGRETDGSKEGIEEAMCVGWVYEVVSPKVAV